MDRRVFLRRSLASAAAGAASLHAPALLAGSPARSGPAPLLGASITQLQAAMSAGRLSSHALTAAYLDRIARIDRAGPRLNSVIEVNPHALAIARACDAERRSGAPRGPLHGMPVLLKDNIATGDAMHTTAGSLALVGIQAPRDAHLVQRLREAGAVILGKTNLSEWANIRSPRSTSGWSARGGLTRNPYALDRNSSGSSSGSAVAVAADLAAVSVGTETDGSIVSPASVNGIVGIKPTVGLVSRDGIIPISHVQDTAGPMARSVSDAALLLGVLAGRDARDSATAMAEAQAIDYTRFLDGNRLDGARLGVVRGSFGSHDEVNALMERTLALLRSRGAVLVDPVELPAIDSYGAQELDALLVEFKAGLARYLAEFAPGAPIASLADLVAWNRRHAERELRWFGQELFEQALDKGGLDDPAYLAARELCDRQARTEGIDKVLAAHRLDALIAPTGGPAWLTDFVNGDHFGGSFSTPAAVAGYPHVTVPAGQVRGLPISLSFVGPAFSEAQLIGLAYAFEQASMARRPPGFVRSLSVGP